MIATLKTSESGSLTGVTLEYSIERRRLETLGVEVVLILAAINATKVVLTIHEHCTEPWPWLALLGGWIAADFVSGFVHWLGDTWGREDWPLVGTGLIHGFREHHLDPTAITKHDFVEASGSISVALVPVLLVALLAPRQAVRGGIAVSFLTIFSIAMLLTNEIHKSAHREKVCRPVAWLQCTGLILSPAHHAAHHAAPFDRCYCISAGWLNPILDDSGFFRALERSVTLVTGSEPRR
jgi:ubiquitin-conjugating enzyme E2 variant